MCTHACAHVRVCACVCVYGCLWGCVACVLNLVSLTGFGDEFLELLLFADFFLALDSGSSKPALPSPSRLIPSPVIVCVFVWVVGVGDGG